MNKCHFCLNLATSMCSTSQTYICENCIKTEDSCEFSKIPGTHPPLTYSLSPENLLNLRIQISNRLKIITNYKENLIKKTKKLINCLIKSHSEIVKILDTKENDLKSMEKKNCLSVDEYKRAHDLFLKDFSIRKIDCKKIYKDIINQYNTCKISEPYIVENSTVERFKRKYLQNLNIPGIKNLNPNLFEVSNDKSIIFLGDKNAIQSYNLNDSSLIYEYKQIAYVVSCFKLSKCNNFLVSGYTNGMTILWNIKNQCLDRIFSESKKGVLYVTISIDCRYIVSINERIVRFFDIQNDKLIGGFESECICCSISPDSRNILLSLNNSKISVFDMESQQIKATFNKHSSKATSLIITNDGLRALSRSENEIFIWALADKKTLVSMDCINILSLDITIDSSYFVFGLSINKVILWDVKLNKARKIIRTSSPVIFVSFFDNEKKVLSASVDGAIFVISTSNFNRESLYEAKSKIISIQITLDRKHLVSSYENQMFRVFELKKLSLISQIPFEKSISSICLSCSLTFLAIGSSDSTLTIYSIEETKPLTVLKKHHGSVNCLAISLDDSLIVSGSSDSSIVIWNIFDDKDYDCLRGHNAGVTCLAITNDNRMIISGSDDHTIIVWGLLDRKIRNTYSGYEFPIKKLIIGIDMRYVYIPCAFGVVKVLDLLENVEKQDFVIHDLDTVKKVLSVYPEAQSFFREAFIFKL